jgi:hypothetical protein
MATVSRFDPNPIHWQTIITTALAFWLSGSLLLDLVIMPSLYATGMMADNGFATAGYSIFWIFNRIEILCAALVLSGFLVCRQLATQKTTYRWPIALAILLFVIPLIYMYALSPEMSALGMDLDLFSPAAIPTGMNQMHQGYFALEILKLVLGGTLLFGFHHHDDSELPTQA